MIFKMTAEEEKHLMRMIEAFPFERADLDKIGEQIKNGGNFKNLINKLLTIARDTQRHLHQVELVLEDIRKSNIK